MRRNNAQLCGITLSASEDFFYFALGLYKICSLLLLLLLGRIAVLRTLMRPILTDRVAWSVGLSVCRSVTLVSPAKTAATIELPFGLRTWVGPGNHVLDGGPGPTMGRGNFFLGGGRMGVPL